MTLAHDMQLSVPPLVDPDWLRQHAGDPGLVLLEVGEDASDYYRGHLPAAGSLDALEELQEPVARGFVQTATFEALMTAKGVTRDSHVVLYAAADPAQATSAFWLLRYYGHPRVSLLDGGKARWLGTGGELVQDAPDRAGTARAYRGAVPDPTVRATRDDVLRRFVHAPPGYALLDCRTPAEFAGHVTHPLDLPIERHRVPGHIPGARNLPSELLLDDAGAFRCRPALCALFVERGVDPGSDVEVAVYCRVAERSSLLWFALRELLGHRRVRNYDGGWAEYGSLVHVPVSH